MRTLFTLLSPPVKFRGPFAGMKMNLVKNLPSTSWGTMRAIKDFRHRRFATQRVSQSISLQADAPLTTNVSGTRGLRATASWSYPSWLDQKVVTVARVR